jgi:hypothetical protein
MSTCIREHGFSIRKRAQLCVYKKNEENPIERAENKQKRKGQTSRKG